MKKKCICQYKQCLISKKYITLPWLQRNNWWFLYYFKKSYLILLWPQRNHIGSLLDYQKTINTLSFYDKIQHKCYTILLVVNVLVLFFCDYPQIKYDPRMRSTTQDRYWLDWLGLRTGRCGVTKLNGLEKVQISFFLRPKPVFCLFGLVNAHISFYSVAQYLTIIHTGQFLLLGLFDLANTHISVYSLWLTLISKAQRKSQWS